MATRTLSGFDLRNLWPSAWGASGKLVITLAQSAVSEDGIEYPKTAKAGGTLRSLGFHWESTITVASSLATCGSVSGLINTDTALPAHTATYNIYVYDSKGKMREKLNAKPFHLHESLNSNGAAFTWEQWVNANEFTQFRGSTTFVADRVTVQSMVDTLTHVKASEVLIGESRLSVAPVSAADPIAEGANSTKLGGAINVLGSPYNATPNTLAAAADNSAILQAAIDDGALGGNSLLLPDYFYIEDGLVLPGITSSVRGTAIYGVGPDTSGLIHTGGGDTISQTGSANGVNLTIRDLGIKAQGPGPASGIRLTNPYHWLIDNVYIQGFISGFSTGFSEGGIVLDGIIPINVGPGTISNSFIQSCAGDGVKVIGDNGSGGFRLIGNRIQANSGWGFRSINSVSTECLLFANDIEGCSLGLVYVEWPTAMGILYNHMESVIPGITPIVLTSIAGLSAASAVAIEGNNISTVGSDYLIDFANSAAGQNGVRILNNLFAGDNSQTAAVRLLAGNNISILDNSLTNIPRVLDEANPSFNAVAYIKEGNNIRWTTGAGINTGAASYRVDGPIRSKLSAALATTNPVDIGTSLNAGNAVSYTPTQDATINLASVPVGLQEFSLIITTSGVSSFTITFGTNFKTTGTLATGTVSGKVFVIKFVCNGTTCIEVSRTAAM